MNKLLTLCAGLLIALHVALPVQAATDWGAVPTGEVVPCVFETYGTNGESLTLTGLAATDVEIIKDGSVTVRASDAGYTLIDTDGIDIGSRTGFHGFTIDTGDNTDAGFYTVGGFFNVFVDAVTVNAQTVRLKACTFRLVAAESNVGTPRADVSHWGTTAVATALVRSNLIQIDDDATAAANLEAWLDLIVGNANGSFPAMGITASGTAQSGSGTSLVLAAATDAPDDTFNGDTFLVWGSTEGDIQVVCASDYVGATDTVTLETAYTTNPTGTIRYVGVGTAGCASSALTAQGVWEYATRVLTANTNLNDPTAAAIADAVLDEDLTAHQTTGSLGAAIGDGDAGAGMTEAGGTGDHLTAVPYNAAWDAEIQSEATDALNAATIPEPSGVPTYGTTTIAQALGYLTAWFRNRVTQTATTKTLRNDANTADIVTCAVSDDATTFVSAECAP